MIDWEGGLSYPKVDHLKQFVVLATQRQAWPFGHEAEEVRALWQAARQKVLLDEAWLGGLLSHVEAPPASQPGRGDQWALPDALASPSRGGPRVDWGDAPDVASFYGREWELDLLSEWVVAGTLSGGQRAGPGWHWQVGTDDEGDAPGSGAFRGGHLAFPARCPYLRSAARVAASRSLLPRRYATPQPASKDARISCWNACAADVSCWCYDNLESFLEEGEEQRSHACQATRDSPGAAPGSRDRASELPAADQPGETERPGAAGRQPGSRACLAPRPAGCRGVPDSCWQKRESRAAHLSNARLIEAYAGNPLALKIVAQTIVELFGGEIAPFLEQGEVVFGGVRELLDEQFARLSAIEQSVLLWLAILREPVNLQELLAVLGVPLPRAQVLEAVDGLHRHSLIERGKLPGSFTLQSVVMEYVVARLIAEATSEIKQGLLSRLIEHGLELATSKEYVRQTQQRLIVTPILAPAQHVPFANRSLRSNCSRCWTGCANELTTLRAMDRRICLRCYESSVGTCAAWTCRSSRCEALSPRGRDAGYDYFRGDPARDRLYRVL